MYSKYYKITSKLFLPENIFIFPLRFLPMIEFSLKKFSSSVNIEPDSHAYKICKLIFFIINDILDARASLLTASLAHQAFPFCHTCSVVTHTLLLLDL